MFLRIRTASEGRLMDENIAIPVVGKTGICLPIGWAPLRFKRIKSEKSEEITGPAEWDVINAFLDPFMQLRPIDHPSKESIGKRIKAILRYIYDILAVC